MSNQYKLSLEDAESLMYEYAIECGYSDWDDMMGQCDDRKDIILEYTQWVYEEVTF